MEGWRGRSKGQPGGLGYACGSHEFRGQKAEAARRLFTLKRPRTEQPTGALASGPLLHTTLAFLLVPQSRGMGGSVCNKTQAERY